MKASKQCPKCDSLRVGYLEALPDVHDRSGGPGTTAPVKHQAVGVVVTRPAQKTFIGLVAPEASVVQGELEAYLCADCGYFEHYVKSPEDVPFDKLEGFHWLNPEAAEAGPYR